MRYLKKFNEGLDMKQSLIDRFIDALFNHNDNFYAVGGGEYKFDKKSNKIYIDLDPYIKEGESYGVDLKKQFLKEIEMFLNGQYKKHWEKFGEINFEGEKNNMLILTIKSKK